LWRYVINWNGNCVYLLRYIIDYVIHGYIQYFIMINIILYDFNLYLYVYLHIMLILTSLNNFISTMRKARVWKLFTYWIFSCFHIERLVYTYVSCNFPSLPSLISDLYRSIISHNILYSYRRICILLRKFT